MGVDVVVQYACKAHQLPDAADIENWVNAAVMERRDNSQVTVRIVDEQEGADLNERWRQCQGATNILSFSYTTETDNNPSLLGDLVLCAPLVCMEASEQRKSEQAHWAHLVVHGSLHLLGFTHDRDRDAGEMEQLETEILESLGYSDPYYISGSP